MDRQYLDSIFTNREDGSASIPESIDIPILATCCMPVSIIGIPIVDRKKVIWILVPKGALVRSTKLMYKLIFYIFAVAVVPSQQMCLTLLATSLYLAFVGCAFSLYFHPSIAGAIS